MKSLKVLCLATGLGLTTLLTSCDENRNVELSNGKINDAQIKVINNIRRVNSDYFTIEIYDTQGNIKASLEYPLLPKGYIQYEDRKVDLSPPHNILESENKREK